MAEEMGAYHLAEWLAMDRIDEEQRKRDEMADRAQDRVRNYKRRR